jgi:eukaryotic-like serine/threonine-protein kinase
VSDQVLGGRYRIERVAGRGGLTEVYQATDLTLDRRVAVKVLHEELDEEQAVRHLFEDAARGAATLTHPNIVSVLDYGDDDGISFVVTDWVDEPTLAALLAEGPMPALRVAEVGVDVAAALAEAHTHGQLHRGLKPSDIFVDRNGEAKVSDFGVTRAAERARSLGRDARMAEATYVSPERAQGRPADPRTDLYGLGLVLYEAATGRPAAMGSSPAEIAAQHVDTYPPRPREVNPAVPAELEAVMARLLAKNPDARLPNADVVRQELQGLLDSGVLVGAGASAVAAATPPPQPRRGYQEASYEEEPALAAAAAAAAGQQQLVRIGAGTGDSTTILPPGPPQYHYDERRRRPPLILWAGLAGLVVLIILIVVALSGGGGGSSTVTVPNVVNKTQDEAVATLTAAGFKVNPVSLPNDNVASGIVYAEDPGAGKKLKKGSTITLSVSSGPIETTTTSPPTTVAPSTVVTQRRTTTTRRLTTTTRKVTPATTAHPATTAPPTTTPPTTVPPTTATT